MIDSPQQIYNLIDGELSFTNQIFRKYDFEKTINGALQNTNITKVSFYKCRFDEEINFESRTIPFIIIFSKATFDEEASFKNVVFEDKVIFANNTIFHKTTDFNSSTFKKDVIFTNSIFNRDIAFIGSTFNGSVDFVAVKCKGRFLLNGADFSEPPYFEGAEIKALLIHLADFGSKKIETLLSELENYAKREVKIGLLIASWQILIGIAEKKCDFKRRQEFHNRLLEVEHYVHGEQPKLPTTAYAIYQALGEGDNYVKPIKFLGLSAYVIAFIISVVFFIENGEIINSLKHSIIITIDSLLPIKFFAPTYIPTITDNLSTTGKAIILFMRIIFNIFSTACLFMAALGLRNKFRVK